MASKSWLIYQLESMKKATQKEVLENILFPDFSKSRSLVLTEVFGIIFSYYCIFFSGVCCKWTDLPGPCGSPKLRAEATTPWPWGPRWVTAPLRLCCHFVSFKIFGEKNTLTKQSLGFLCTPASPGKHTWIALEDFLQQLLTALACHLHVKAWWYFWDSRWQFSPTDTPGTWGKAT